MNEWLKQALCSGAPESMFFKGRGHAGYEKARAVCMRCPVRGECLEAAMAEERTLSKWERFGMRGGRTPEERAEEQRRRKAEAA